MNNIISQIRKTILLGNVLFERVRKHLPGGIQNRPSNTRSAVARQLAARFGRIRALDFDAMLRVKAGRPLVNSLLSLVIPCGGKKNHSWLRILMILLSHFNKIRKAHGAPGLVKYLKTAALTTQQVLAGQRLRDMSPLGARFGRSKTGLPRFLPVGVRQRLIAGDYVLAKFLLTVFNMYRVIEFIGPLKTSTITAPSKAVSGFESTLDKYIPGFTKLFSPDASTLVSKMKLEPFPIFKRSPNCMGAPKDGFGSFSTHPFALHRAAWALRENPGVFVSWKRLSAYFGKGRSFVYPTLRLAHMFKPDLVGGSMKGRIGKIGIKVEPAGKVRLFAMVDPWTQWLMNPLHKGIFKILRRHPMDGTFDQTAPLKRAFTWKSLYSLDLTAATDRLPISLQVSLLSKLIGRLPAQDWKTVLVGRYYELSHGPAENRVRENLKYSVGQPMGALSSWAMLAYTHHFIVQCAAWESKITSRNSLFRDYAILGDDVVIGNTAVARHYLRIVKSLGVDCNLFKSISSPKGIGLEFAKRNIIRGHDISPVPIKEYWAALETIPNMVQFARKYSLSVSKALTVAGFGWRVVSRSEMHLSKVSSRVRNFRLSYFIPTDNASLKKFFSMRKTTQDWFVKSMDAFLVSEFERMREQVDLNRLYSSTRRLYNEMSEGLRKSFVTLVKRFALAKLKGPKRYPSSLELDKTLTRLMPLYIELWRFSISTAQNSLDKRYMAYSNFFDKIKGVGGIPELLGYHGPLQMYSYFIQMTRDWLSLRPALLFNLSWMPDPPKFGLDSRTTRLWKRWSGVFSKGKNDTSPPSHLEGGFILPGALIMRILKRGAPRLVTGSTTRSRGVPRFLRPFRSLWLVSTGLRLLRLYRLFTIVISILTMTVMGLTTMVGVDLSLLVSQILYGFCSQIIHSFIVEFGRWTLVLPFMMYDQISLDLFLPHNDIGSPLYSEDIIPLPDPVPSGPGARVPGYLVKGPLLIGAVVLTQVVLENYHETPMWIGLWQIAGPRMIAQGLVLDQQEFIWVYAHVVWDQIWGTFVEQVAAPWFVIMWLSAVNPQYFIDRFPYAEFASWGDSLGRAFGKFAWELFFMLPDPVTDSIWLTTAQVIPDGAYWFIMEILFGLS